MLKKFFSSIGLALLIALSSSCVQQQGVKLTTEMKAQIALLPQDAGAYGYVNVQRLHQAKVSRSLVDSVKQQLSQNAKFDSLIKRTGLDPQKDILEAYLAFKMEKERKHPAGMVVAKGNFDVPKIVGFLKEKDQHNKLNEEKSGAHILYSAAEGDVAFCFYDSQTLVGGARNWVEDWLQKSDGPKPAISPVLLQELDKLKYKQGMWLSINPEVWKTKMDNRDLKRLNGLKSLTALGFSMDVAEDVRFSAKGVFEDTEKAGLFEEAIKGFIATGKLSVSDDRDVIDLLNSIQVKSDGKLLLLDFKLSEQDIKQLLEKKKSLATKMHKIV